ncbi:hypothetical protein MIDIC_230106 [Alphaproteobacteria bacterium]
MVVQALMQTESMYKAYSILNQDNFLFTLIPIPLLNAHVVALQDSGPVMWVSHSFALTIALLVLI